MNGDLGLSVSANGVKNIWINVHSIGIPDVNKIVNTLVQARKECKKSNNNLILVLTNIYSDIPESK